MKPTVRYAMLLCVLLWTVLILSNFRLTSSPEDVTINESTAYDYTVKEDHMQEGTLAYITQSEEPVAESVDEEIDTDTYLELMVQACLEGNSYAGILAEKSRNKVIDENNLDTVKISWEDLFLMSKIIYIEAGSEWLSDEHQMMVGCVLYNRSVSSEFPDTIKECVYQESQYSLANTEYFEELLPDKRCVENAIKVLSGDFSIPDSVVFQANFTQGSGIYKSIEDDYLRTTYFCYSEYPELYN